MSTCTVDLSDKLPFEGWLVLGWILAMSHRVIEMMREIEVEERLRGGGESEEDGRKADSCGDGLEKGKEETVHDVIFLLDQRSDLVRPESPKCLHHHQ